jgi:hypothetical protein
VRQPAEDEIDKIITDYVGPDFIVDDWTLYKSCPVCGSNDKVIVKIACLSLPEPHEHPWHSWRPEDDKEAIRRENRTESEKQAEWAAQDACTRSIIGGRP